MDSRRVEGVGIAGVVVGLGAVVGAVCMIFGPAIAILVGGLVVAAAGALLIVLAAAMPTAEAVEGGDA